jgi:hypothetical protein
MLGGNEIPGTGVRLEWSSFLMGAVLMVVLLFAFHAMYLAPGSDIVVGANGAGLPPTQGPMLGANGAGLPPTSEGFGPARTQNATTSIRGLIGGF